MQKSMQTKTVKHELGAVLRTDERLRQKEWRWVHAGNM
jgi:hypothetical protein